MYGDQDLRSTQIESPERTTSGWARADIIDYCYLALALAVCFSAHLALGGSFTMLVCAIVLILPTLRYNEFGRAYRNLGIALTGLYQHLVHRDVRWGTYDELVAEHEALPSKKALKPYARKKGKSLPFQIRRVGGSGSSVALLYDAAQKVDTLIFTASGSDFAALDIHSKRAFLEELDHSLLRYVNGEAGEFHLKCGFTVHKRGLNRAAIIDGWQSGFDRDVLSMLYPGDPELQSLASLESFDDAEQDALTFIGQNLQQVLQLSAESDSELDGYFVWTIRSNRNQDKSLAEDADNDDTINELVEKIIEKMLSCQFVNPRVLDLAGVRRFVNDGIKAATCEDRQRWEVSYPLAAGELLEETEERLRAEFELDSPLVGSDDGDLDRRQAEFEIELEASESRHWPQEHIIERRDYSVIDGTFTTVVLLTGKKRFTFPDFWAELDHVDAPLYTRAQVGETYGSGFMYGLMNILTPIRQEARQKGIGLDTPGARKAEERMLEKHANLYDSGLSTRYTSLVAVHGETRKEMLRHLKTVTNLAKSKGLNPKRIKGRRRQLHYAVSAVLAIGQG